MALQFTDINKVDVYVRIDKIKQDNESKNTELRYTEQEVVFSPVQDTSGSLTTLDIPRLRESLTFPTVDTKGIDTYTYGYGLLSALPQYAGATNV